MYDSEETIASDCLYERFNWIIDSLDSFKNVDSLMKHCCVLIKDAQQFSRALFSLVEITELCLKFHIHTFTFYLLPLPFLGKNFYATYFCPFYQSMMILKENTQWLL